MTRADKDLRIVVGGFLGLLPAGGVTWDYVQYPVGFANLGCDVYYVEDTRLWPVFQGNAQGEVSCSANVAHLASVMEAFGLPGRWAYRDEVSGDCFGMSENQVREICRTADIFVNISCSTAMRDEYRAIPVRALIDSDPMFTQIQYVTQAAFTGGEPGMREMVHAHTHHFTFGENVGATDCRVPTCGINWLPTRQPVCLWLWPEVPLPSRPEPAFTTVMNWTAGRKLEYNGETWGQKDVEWQKVMSLPGALPDANLAMAVGQTTGQPFPTGLAEAHGWRVLDPEVYAPEWRSYRTFIQESLAEFSVAKETYVKARTGWFSCRSACYLASGRPVILQDTGWTKTLHCDAGLLAFEDLDSAVDALTEVKADPERHSRAARAVAESYFDSREVLRLMLAQMGW